MPKELDAKTTELLNLCKKVGYNLDIEVSDLTPLYLKKVLTELTTKRLEVELKRYENIAIKEYLNSDLSDKQIDRYRSKYKLAQKAQQEKKYLSFRIEATLKGTTNKKIVEAILEKGEKWESFYDDLNNSIDAIRVGTLHLIEVEDYQELQRFLYHIKDNFKLGDLLEKILSKPEEIEWEGGTNQEPTIQAESQID
jgi:hypothetical protein